jgi:hypothetical protein
MLTLENIIDAQEYLEFKKAVAVRMFLSDFRTEDIPPVNFPVIGTAARAG